MPVPVPVSVSVSVPVPVSVFVSVSVFVMYGICKHRAQCLLEKCIILSPVKVSKLPRIQHRRSAQYSLQPSSRLP